MTGEGAFPEGLAQVSEVLLEVSRDGLSTAKQP